MLVRSLTLIMCYHVCQCQVYHKPLTTRKLVQMEHIHNVAAFGDAAHRGPRWYDYDSDYTHDTDSDLNSDVTASTSSLESSTTVSSEAITDEDVSSVSTAEKTMKVRTYRDCTPCPHDMMKKYKNMGIKWICGGYQRARRSFKSYCMMRYRNCQDGTMFVKLYDHRCEDDIHHGRSWFYHYRV